MKLENPTVYSCLRPGMAISGGDRTKRGQICPQCPSLEVGSNLFDYYYFFYSKSAPPRLKGQCGAIQKKRKNQLLFFFFGLLLTAAHYVSSCSGLGQKKKLVLHWGKYWGVEMG